MRIPSEITNDLIIKKNRDLQNGPFINQGSSKIFINSNSVINTHLMKLSFVLFGTILPANGITVPQGISNIQLENFKDLKYMTLDFSAIRKDLDKSMECSCQN